MDNPQQSLKSYKDSSLNTYPIKVSHMTQTDIGRLKVAIARLDLPGNVFIYTTGSDGKFEKANRKESPAELIILCDSHSKKLVEARVNKLVKSNLIPMDNRIEWIDPSKNSLRKCTITDTVAPSRFLHNLPLSGSEEQLDELTLHFVDEIQKMPQAERRRFRNKFVVEHTQQMKKAISGKETHEVDLAQGVLSYSGMGRKAAKYSLLRPIQYTLDLALVDAIRTKQRPQKEYVTILRNMPRQVPDQIDYMYKLGLLPNLSKTDVGDLKQAYTLGLFYFQTAQHLVSSMEGSPVQFPIPDKEELAKAYADTVRILEKM